ncbi:DNA alkylation repair protein [Thaumasiovibrio sp. DFM-14]|uniref:DNA alkylation repair protein n=1 Tax=Thaumasiovibrio sp. DFM-14 TaxID=3384792 RepID=UPI0039A03E8E
MSSVFPVVLIMQKLLTEAGESTQAREMQAYMKIAKRFYGVKAPERKAIFKQAQAYSPIDTFEKYTALIRWLWSGQYREEQYLALDVAEGYSCFRTVAAMDLYEELIFSADNWDVLDRLAVGLVGPLLLEHSDLEARVVKWRTDSNMWVRRASLLVRLKHKQATNVVLLEETILMLAQEEDYFIRKAIGWVLREYSKTDPAYVNEFLRRHVLSPLSYREATKIMVKSLS